MELNLHRVDYTIVGLTEPNCMKLLPGDTPKSQQKVAIADSDGILQVFSIKKDDIQIHFKTLPGPPITALKTAGAIGTPYDKIFIATENEVKGYTKKGKLFLTFDSGITEKIQSMFVLGSELILCGTHIFNHYRDCKEVGSYLCGDKIVDVISMYSHKTRRFLSLIACEGRMIRVIEHARVTFSIEVENTPTVLYFFEENNDKLILFGTVDGRIGIVDVDSLQGFERWLLTNETNSAAISCIDTYDLTGNGNKNLIVGRQDGNVEVYNLNMFDPLDKPILIYEMNCNESVTGMQTGIVGCQGYEEILIVTYTGRVIGLTTQTIDSNVDNTGSFTVDNSQKVQKLKLEIEELQNKVMKERESYQTSTHSFFDEFSAISLLSIKDSFTLEKTTSTYTLSIEVPTAIDNILLQSNVSLKLIDVEKNSAVVSYSDSDTNSGNKLLATYRCQINTNRLELKIRTEEGEKGTLQVYVTPLVQPKCSRNLQYDIKALSLHYRIHDFDSKRSFNKLIFKGGFSLAEIHSWISNCLPEVPEKPQILDKNILWFQSSLLGTILQCSYTKNEGEFLSDNVSTISILKDYLTIEATKKKIKVEFATTVADDSIDTVLDLINNKIVTEKSNEKDLTLLNALNELEVTNEEISGSLCQKYKEILANSKTIIQKSQPGCLERLYGTISNLYVNYYKFKGANVVSKLPNLLRVLENYSYEGLLDFFRPNRNDE
ncbi:Bardet-Biedl syndrome 7 protein homolog [Aethina tumida]|uniref:Bardet-Biedl syndrome 7 protein homolog n=1 Tax=Aethina tumida TaxID=116153 RepID=UPI00096B46B4|nr:Bardet-Biedl syndrome 7 protein homolog [Aethina tumida]